MDKRLDIDIFTFLKIHLNLNEVLIFTLLTDVTLGFSIVCWRCWDDKVRTQDRLVVTGQRLGNTRLGDPLGWLGCLTLRR